MLKIKTYKYCIYPTKKRTLILTQTLDACQILCNLCIVDRKNAFEKTGKRIMGIRRQEILKIDKSKINSLDGIHSQVLQNVLFRIDRSFQNPFRRVKDKSGKAGYPRFKGIGQYDSIHYPQAPGFQLTPRERVPKMLSDRVHSCPFCKTVQDRDHNTAVNNIKKSTAGTAEICAWGEAVPQCPQRTKKPRPQWRGSSLCAPMISKIQIDFHASPLYAVAARFHFLRTLPRRGMT